MHSTNINQKLFKLNEISVRAVFSKYLEVFFEFLKTGQNILFLVFKNTLKSVLAVANVSPFNPLDTSSNEAKTFHYCPEIKVLKHFPFSKVTLSFAKGKMLGTAWHPADPSEEN